MPNLCEYDIKIVGKRKKDVEAVVDYLRTDYNEEEENCPLHPWRVFSCDGETYKEDDYFVFEGSGDCAWSVRVCMFDGEMTYQNDHPNSRGRTIAWMCKEYHVRVEIFSKESGCCFAEHYLINNKGEIEIAESTDYEEHYNEETDEYEEIGGFEVKEGGGYAWAI